jgi:hypothetical protein
MKKSKCSLMVLAVVAALSSAFATKPDCLQCEDAQQFHKNGSGGYEALGPFGVDYDCDYQWDKTCTYYRPNANQPNVYAACRIGIWIDLISFTKK